ncbi:MAG: formylglycine-generating enzyme family protein [Anaerolineales bacterium]|nr:MAG: formylglycine-generating enzyme family protein [Anaerolineales bacterium]
MQEVYLDSYYIDSYEVTNAAYRVCVEEGGCARPYSTKRFDSSSYANHPVAFVDWNQAKTYCEWRGTQLPTEAQWEKAARGVDGRTYPWGEGIDCDKANYDKECVGDTTEVGSYESSKSPYGLYDMAGNVWEWVNDWYSDVYYQSSPLNNPLGPDDGELRVQRGGSWSSGDFLAQSFLRLYGDPVEKNYVSGFYGFRCARNVTP